jgi:hypothetical protein
MKNVVGVLSLGVAVVAVAWSFGSGELTTSAACLAIAAWCGLVWSCLK